MRSGSRRGVPRFLRGVALTATAGLAASLLAACGGSADKGEPIDVMVYEDASTTVQETFVEKFNADSDIDINLIKIGGSTYQDEMRAAMASQDPPDIFFNWGAGSISDFVANKELMDLTEVLGRDQRFENAFVANILEGAMIKGRYYGIPMRGVQPVILFYNETMFDQHDVEPPETFEEFLYAVDVFKEAGITPVALGGGDAWTELMWMEILLDRYGGAEVFQRIQSGETAAWGDDAVRWTAETVRELVEMGAFGEDFRSTTYTDDEVSTFFAEGGAAMHLMGSWEYPNQLANQPEFAAEDLAYMNFPVIEGGKGDPGALVGNTTNYWSVHANLGAKGEEDRLAAAIEFLKLSSSPEYTEKLIDNGDVPTTHNAEVLIDSHANPEYARFQFEMVSNAPSFQLSWDQAIPADQATPMVNAIQELFAGEKSPDEFIDAMLQNGG